MPPAFHGLKRAGTRSTVLALTTSLAAVAFAAPATAHDRDAAVGFQVDSAAENLRFDYNSDGYNDFVTLYRNGGLYFYAGYSGGKFGNGEFTNRSWGDADLVMAGRLTDDDFPDVLVRDNSDGSLVVLPGDGAGRFDDDPIPVASDWHTMGVFAVLDYDGDGVQDILAVRKSDGDLIHFPGLGGAEFGAGVSVEEGFNGIDMIVSTGDVDRDGTGDFLVRIGRTQKYLHHLSGSENPVTLPAWLADPTQARRYDRILGVGDWDENGSRDLLTLDSVTESVYRQSFTASGTMGGFATLREYNFDGYSFAPVVDRTYDYNMDGAGDIVARRNSNDTTYAYFGNGTGGFSATRSWGTEFGDLNLLEHAGDFTGDGRPDLIGRVASNGWLYVYPGDGAGGYDYDARIRIGTGWNAMDTIVSGYDLDGDSITDIVAHEPGSDRLWIYSGKGNGKVNTKLKLDDDAAFIDMKQITLVGDLSHGGLPDLVAVRKTDNCLVLFSGKNGFDKNYFKQGKEITCGWSSHDAIAGVGDFDEDGHTDLVARRNSDDKLLLYKGDGASDFAEPVVIGSGWNKMDLIA